MPDIIKTIEKFASVSNDGELRGYALEAAAEITRLRADLAAAEAREAKLREALTKIANAPSEMTWGENDEVHHCLGRMEGIADAALSEKRGE